ncbi:septum formation family protein [Blastococcus litoris]|uniref:septum formation family protein n=1 Tax=Blastococcus litoris TaxID=2171622 RepID=UPI0013DF8A01|nr:septum formation family protein [Blastococcus litoris]
MRGRGLRAAVLGGVVSVALAGCTTVVGGHATAEAASVAAGLCYMTANPELLSPGNVAGCDAEHSVEVLGVRRLPADLAAHDRRDLMSTVDGPSPLFGPYGMDVCGDVLLTSSGLADVLDLPEDPARRKALAVTPIASAWNFFTVPQETFWSRGERTVVCGVAYSDKLGAPQTLAWTEDEPMFAAFTTSGYRADLRWCERYGKDPAAASIVGCDDPHDWEAIFEFDAAAVLDPDMLPRISVGAETAGQYRLLAGACEELAPELVPDAVRHGLVGAQIVGAPALDWGTPRTAGGEPVHRASCGVISPPGRLIEGSVFDEDVRFEPR